MKNETANTDEQSSPTDGPDVIAIELKKAREAKGYGMSDVHRLTGLSRNTLHQYETGSRKPGTKELLKLCEVLEVTPNRLLFGLEEPFGKVDGVLRPLARLAQTDPGKALGLAAMMMPIIAAILSKVGAETLEAIATIADETLRSRDPETFTQFANLVRDLSKEDVKALVAQPKDAQAERIKTLIKQSGLPLP
ncbi:helix-turn-helix domain-containing protein [Zoogloea sp.]|uniref:helix-turn-helix domain-containing protein n=1 Tax=Zoogloea sp. TaxID=49181 RepID=UPI0035B224CC